jgi:hypothetical protein
MKKPDRAAKLWQYCPGSIYQRVDSVKARLKGLKLTGTRRGALPCLSAVCVIVVKLHPVVASEEVHGWLSEF